MTTETVETTVTPSDVKRAFRDVRYQLDIADRAMDRGDLKGAYAAAEKAQHAAFDAKDRIASMAGRR